jgi:hypothetical protein
MRNRHFPLLIALLCLLSASTVLADTETLGVTAVVRLKFPGSSSSFALDMNDWGQIVGGYLDASGTEHGFLDSGGVFSTIDFPGATTTRPFAIASSGEIAGIYVGSDHVSHGFVLNRNTFSTVDFPGAASTEILGVNASGEVVGDYFLPGSTAHYAFLESAGVFTTISVPGATLMAHTKSTIRARSLVRTGRPESPPDFWTMQASSAPSFFPESNMEPLYSRSTALARWRGNTVG